MTEVHRFKYQANQKDKQYRAEEEGWLSLSKALQIVDHNAQKQLEETEVKMQLEPLLNELSDRQRTVVQCLYFNDFTLEQTANLENVTPARVQQINEKALEKLREVMNSKEWGSKIKILMNSQNG